MKANKPNRREIFIPINYCGKLLELNLETYFCYKLIQMKMSSNRS